MTELLNILISEIIFDLKPYLSKLSEIESLFVCTLPDEIYKIKNTNLPLEDYDFYFGCNNTITDIEKPQIMISLKDKDIYIYKFDTSIYGKNTTIPDIVININYKDIQKQSQAAILLEIMKLKRSLKKRDKEISYLRDKINYMFRQE